MLTPVTNAGGGLVPQLAKASSYGSGKEQKNDKSDLGKNIEPFLQSADLLFVGHDKRTPLLDALRKEHIDSTDKLLWLTDQHLSALGLTLGQKKRFSDVQNAYNHWFFANNATPGTKQEWDMEQNRPIAVSKMSPLNNTQHGQPLKIDVQVKVNELMEVSSWDQTFQVDIDVCAFITLADYAFDLACQDGGALTPVRCAPDISFTNLVSSADDVKVSAAMCAHPTLGQRFCYTASTVGTFVSDFQFEIYPFDSQLLNVDVCLDFGTQCEIVLSKRDQHVFTETVISTIPDTWSILRISDEAPYKLHVSQYEGEDTTENHVLAKMAIQRRCTANVLYPFLNYFLITVSAFTAFSVAPEDVSDRIAISLTCLLTIVAYEEVPPDHPQTVGSSLFGNWAMYSTIVVVFLTFVEAVIGKLMACPDSYMSWTFEEFSIMDYTSRMSKYDKLANENSAGANYSNVEGQPWCFQEFHDSYSVYFLVAIYLFGGCVYFVYALLRRICLKQKLLSSKGNMETSMQKMSKKHSIR